MMDTSQHYLPQQGLSVATLLTLVCLLAGCHDGLTPLQTRTGHLYIRSQADLDSLVGVRSISGSLLIEKRFNNDASDPVVDLGPLSDLEQVSGNLRIDDIDTIESLAPLANLQSVGNNFYIGHNDNISSLAPLRNVTHVGVILFVQDNDRLKDLDGLQGIDFENGADLDVALNDSLTGLHGLENIRTVTGRTNQRFSFASNNQLGTLQGLNNLLVARSLVLWDNPLLTDISALSSLRVVNTLDLKDCPLLTDLTVFAKLDTCKTLNLAGIPVGSLSMFAGVEIEHLGLSRLPLSDLRGLGDRSFLLGLSLYSMPKISALQGLDSLRRIEYLIIQDNPGLSGLDGLSGLESVKYVRILGNPELCPSLIELWLESVTVDDEVHVLDNGDC